MEKRRTRITTEMKERENTAERIIMTRAKERKIKKQEAKHVALTNACLLLARA